MKDRARAIVFERREVRFAIAIALGLGLLVAIATRNVWPVYSETRTSTTPGPQLSQASYPKAAASLTPAASPTPSPQSSPSPEPSGTPTAPSGIPSGAGHWDVNGATVKAGGVLATEIDTGGNVFSGSASATKGGWSTRFGVTGQGPITIQGTAKGPSPVVIDLTVRVFNLPITVHGTPGIDLSVSVGTPRSSLLTDMVPVAAVQPRMPLAETPEEVATRVLIDTLRGTVAFALVGFLLLLVVPGLHARGVTAAHSVPLSRLGIGAILAIDIPLGAILLVLIGVPLGLWWVGLIVLALFAALVVASYAFSGYQLGVLILERLDAGRLMWIAELALGVLLLVIAAQIPYVGAVVTIIAVLYGIGSMLYAPAAAVAPVQAPGPELEARPAAELPATGKRIVE